MIEKRYAAEFLDWIRSSVIGRGLTETDMKVLHSAWQAGFAEGVHSRKTCEDEVQRTKIWRDLKTAKEKAAFLRSGRAWDTGIIAASLAEEVARAFDIVALVEKRIINKPPRKMLEMKYHTMEDTPVWL